MCNFHKPFFLFANFHDFFLIGKFSWLLMGITSIPEVMSCFRWQW